jgi:hypothetical protein
MRLAQVPVLGLCAGIGPGVLFGLAGFAFVALAAWIDEAARH